MFFSRSVFLPLFLLLSLCVASQAAKPKATARKPANAATLEQASKAYAEKDFVTTQNLLIPLAEKGNPVATFGIGLMAARGEGREKNLKDAETWWKKSADAGYPDAQFNLGYLYFTGVLGAQDIAKARELWAKAARRKHLDALFGLGLLCMNGGGGTKNLQAGVRNLREAAVNGHPLAQYELGMAYLDGKGVKKNEKRARTLLAQAATFGISEAKTALEKLDAVALQRDRQKNSTSRKRSRKKH